MERPDFYTDLAQFMLTIHLNKTEHRLNEHQSNFSYFLADLYKAFMKHIMPAIGNSLVQVTLEPQDLVAINNLIDQLEDQYVIKKDVTTLAVSVLVIYRSLPLKDIQLPERMLKRLHTYHVQGVKVSSRTRSTQGGGDIPQTRTTRKDSYPAINMKRLGTLSKSNWDVKDLLFERYQTVFDMLDLSHARMDSILITLLHIHVFTNKDTRLMHEKTFYEENQNILTKIMAGYQLEKFLQRKFVPETVFEVISNLLVKEFPSQTNSKSIGITSINYYQRQIIKKMYEAHIQNRSVQRMSND